MSLPEFRGARGSNAGDDFHELWASSQALTLLDRETDLIAVAVEGLRPEDEKGSPAEAFDAVDCAMFYNGSSVAAAERIEIIQFKYSAANPDGPWTVARLTSSSAKTRDNSVIRRLADTFNELRTKRNDSPAGIRLQLISNQPADPDVVQLFQDVVSGQNLSDQAKTAGDKLRKSSGLKDDTFREFAAAIDLSQTGSRFLIRENVLRTISTWTEGDARALTDSLLRFMRQKMMPESKGEWIRRETILAELGFSDVRALFPCPPELAAVRHVIRRKMSSELVGEMISGRKHVCVDGHAGCGKTTALREIESQLPMEQDTESRWSAAKWTIEPRGWLFLTSRADQSTALQAIYAIWLELLITRCLAKQFSKRLWFIIDELPVLRYIPNLQKLITLGRECNVPLIIGLQGRAQLDERYGQNGAEVILSQPVTKVFLRTSEPKAAKWVSDSIGSQARERIREGVTAGVQGWRDSVNYTPERRIEPAVLDSVIAGLPNLRGYLKFLEHIVEIEYTPEDRPNRAASMILRPLKSGPSLTGSQSTTPPTGVSASGEQRSSQPKVRLLG